MIKKLLFVAVFAMSSLIALAQSAKEVDLNTTVNDLAVRGFQLDRVYQDGSTAYIYLTRDLDSDEAIFGRNKITAMGAVNTIIYGYVEFQIDMSSMQVLSEKAFYVQSKESGHKEPKKLWALNGEGKSTGMIADENQVIMESSFVSEFPNYEKGIPSDFGAREMTRADYDAMPDSYFENKLLYKGFANKVEGFKIVTYKKKPYEAKKKGFFSDLSEQFKTTYEKDFDNIEWENYNGGDKKNLWQRSYGKNFTDNVTGMVYAQHAFRSKEDKHSIYKKFELVTFDANGKLVKRVDKKYDHPSEIVYSGATYGDVSGKINSVNYVIGDIQSLTIIGLKKKYGQFLDPTRRIFVRFDDAGQLVYDKEFKMAEVTRLRKNWLNSAGDDIFFGMRAESKAPVTITVTKAGELTEKEETGQAASSLQGLAGGKLYRTHKAGDLVDVIGGGKTFITKTYKAGSSTTNTSAAYGHAYAPIYNDKGELMQIVPFIRMDARDASRSPIIRLEKDTDDYMIYAYRDELMSENGYGKYVKSVFVNKSNWSIKEAEMQDLGSFSTYSNDNMYMTFGLGKEMAKLVVIQ